MHLVVGMFTSLRVLSASEICVQVVKYTRSKTCIYVQVLGVQDGTAAPDPARKKLKGANGQAAAGPGENGAATGAEASEVAQVCAQAARLGIQIDAADAVAKGVKPEALRAKVLADLAARSDAAGIIATTPAPGAKESPIVAAAKKSAAASR